jgi:beta-galactosidase
MYVVHGGTNFGLTAGANGLNWSLSDYWGALTSYDYDAPIN